MFPYKKTYRERGNGSGKKRMDGGEKKKCEGLERKMWHLFFTKGICFPSLVKLFSILHKKNKGKWVYRGMFFPSKQTESKCPSIFQ